MSWSKKSLRQNKRWRPRATLERRLRYWASRFGEIDPDNGWKPCEETYLEFRDDPVAVGLEHILSKRRHVGRKLAAKFKLSRDVANGKFILFENGSFAPMPPPGGSDFVGWDDPPMFLTW